MPKVTIEPEALAIMALHAQKHSRDAVFGLLIGKSGTQIQSALPVCHGPPPTRPLAEMAMRMASETIVGWYTAPALLEDTKAGPVALRLAASLETGGVEPTLVVLQNKELATWIESGNGKAAVAYGKDFGGQYLEPLETVLAKSESAQQAVTKAISAGVSVMDLVDHYDGDGKDVYGKNAALTDLVQQTCKQ